MADYVFFFHNSHMNISSKDRANTPYARRLRELMTIHGHRNAADVERAAEKMGLHLNQPTIHRILNDNVRAPAEETREALATLYDVTKAQVIGDEPLSEGVQDDVGPYFISSTGTGAEVARIAEKVIETLRSLNREKDYTPEYIGNMIGFAFDNKDKSIEDITSNIIAYERFANSRK